MINCLIRDEPVKATPHKLLSNLVTVTMFQLTPQHPSDAFHLSLLPLFHFTPLMIPTRENAWQLVTEYTQSDSLCRHMLAVECAMRAYATRFSEDPELWGIVGLLHDFDYERYQDISVEGHPAVGARLLRERQVDETIVQGILSHAPEVTGRRPETKEWKKRFMRWTKLPDSSLRSRWSAHQKGWQTWN